MTLTTADYLDVVDGTWPAAQYHHLGPWTLREGKGGGSRVSSATANGPVTEAEIDAAEAAMLAMGQRKQFMIRPGDTDLDRMLEARGYQVLDPVNMYACPVGLLTDVPLPRVSVFTIWEPLEIMREIWATGGIGPARLEVMARAKAPKTGLLARHNDKPAGTAYAAIHNGVAMVHAVEILPHQRRAGMGRWMMRAAAIWAADNGAHTLSVVCTRRNDAANGLYASLGMQPVGQYHYRHLPQEIDPS